MFSTTRFLLWLLCCSLCCIGIGLTLLLLFLFPLTSNLEKRLRRDYVDVDYEVQDGEVTGELPDERHE
jgi:hypothetical protein